MFARKIIARIPILLVCLAVAGTAQEPALSPDLRLIPGGTPTPALQYRNPSAGQVLVAGSWDTWSNRYSMVRQGDVWTLDVRALHLEFGQYEFKFLPNGKWEDGGNRTLCINEDGILERPSDLILSATVDDRNQIDVTFRRNVPDPSLVKVRLVPDLPIRSRQWASAREPAFRQGYWIVGDNITFVLDEKTYGLNLTPADRVAVAGNFSWWDSNGTGTGRWLLHDDNNDDLWELTTQLSGMRSTDNETNLLFKFVINGDRWLAPPSGAVNATPDGQGHANLRVIPDSIGSDTLRIVTEKPLDLSRNYTVIIDGIGPRPVWRTATPEGIFEKIKSTKTLGAVLDRSHRCTTYRIFSPRARRVFLDLYPTPEYQTWKPEHRVFKPAERYPLWKDEQDGVWEISLLGLDAGKYYSFNIDGPTGNGESFFAEAQLGDPYARAMARAYNNSIVVDPDETNQWFGGWTDQSYVPAAPQDAVIYELHIRDITMHPSSGLPLPLRGTYQGLLETLGKGTGLDHLKKLGVTTLEFMPLAELWNGEKDNDYTWGYGSAFYFAPESCYARQPLKGSQYFEFKKMVDELHRQGFGVVLDVIFNHIGEPNIFNWIDKKYYFRLNPDFSFSNFSGCGNDFRTEMPMTRKLIVDNMIYWMNEFHVDGFRFDLAELIDMGTMMAIRDATRAINTNVLLISEPWSLRGQNKQQLKGTGWSAWNNDFRYAAKDFVMGRHNRDWLQKNIFGSVETWAADPRQPLNYLESHDDMALADEFCTRPDHDGRNLQKLDVSLNRLAATVLFTSLGIPMIAEGEEFLRSKQGFANSFDKGDDVNAVRWTDRERPEAQEALAYYQGLIQLRRSPQGAAFRVAQRPPSNYYQWISPEDPQAMGYMVNSPHIHAGAGFVVLLNADASPTSFSVPFPAGHWRLIGDGEQIDPAGLPENNVIQGGQSVSVEVPGQRSFIFMDGF